MDVKNQKTLFCEYINNNNQSMLLDSKLNIIDNEFTKTDIKENMNTPIHQNLIKNLENIKENSICINKIYSKDFDKFNL